MSALNSSGKAVVIFSICLQAFLVCSVLANCPKFQAPHTTASNEVICCHPVFNCPLNHEVQYCNTAGGQDVCQPCDSHMINTYLVSSMDTPVRRCFNKSSRQEKCPKSDTIPVEDHLAVNGMPCRCSETKCVYGKPSVMCNSDKQCATDELINHKTGECTSCGEHRYTKPQTCGPCYWNETSWRIAQKDSAPNDNPTETKDIAETMTVPTEKVPDSKVVVTNKSDNAAANDGYVINPVNLHEDSGASDDNEEESKKGVSIVVVLIVILVLMCISIAIALILCARHQIQAGEHNTCLVKMYLRICSICSKHGPEPIPQEDAEATPESPAAANGSTKPVGYVTPTRPEDNDHPGNGSVQFVEMSLLSPSGDGENPVCNEDVRGELPSNGACGDTTGMDTQAETARKMT